MNRPTYTIILSIDSMSSSDLELISLLPNFKRYIEHAAICDHVTSVYPSLTYPAHASIVTGKYPVHHGIINNTLLQPYRDNPDWFWDDYYIQGKTIYGEMIEKGKTVASLLWPITAKSKIQYNFPEVFPIRKGQSQVILSLKNGSPFYQIQLEKKYGKKRNGIEQPELDEFVQASLLYTLRNYKPNLTLVHFTSIDKSRHLYGTSAPEVFRSMERLDDYLGEIMDVLNQENMTQDTALIILGDHSQIDVHSHINLNKRFEQDGYIQSKGNKIIKWKVYAQPCDGSCYIYLNDSTDKRLYDEVYEYLHNLQGEKKSGINKIYTGKEAKQFGADKNCSFMLEARIGYYFAHKDNHLKATHGYLPTIQGYQTIFMASGKGIKQGVRISNTSIVDEAPTIAKLLDIDLGPTDGRVIQDILDS